MRVLALDHGSARCGAAISDQSVLSNDDASLWHAAIAASSW